MNYPSLFLCQVYRRVFIQDNEYDTVIGFYNRIFMDAMKYYVLQFAQNRQVVCRLM